MTAHRDRFAILALAALLAALAVVAWLARPPTLAPCLRNLGTAPAPRFTARADDGTTWTAAGLGAGQELCLEPKASRARSVTVDPDSHVPEADETNNTRVVPRPAVPVTGAGRAGGSPS